MEIGERIRQIRRTRELTQATVAEAIGVTVSQLSRIENGQSDPDTDMLRRISKALGVTVTDLFDGAPSAFSKVISPQFAVFFKLAGHLSDEEMQQVMKLAEAIAGLEKPDKETVEALISRLKRK